MLIHTTIECVEKSQDRMSVLFATCTTLLYEPISVKEKEEWHTYAENRVPQKSKQTHHTFLSMIKIK